MSRAALARGAIGRTKVALAAMLALASAAASAQNDAAAIVAWPERPLRVIASVAAGTSLDALARLTATRLAAALGQQVIVENRGGAAGAIATDAVARAAADGHTLLFTSNSIATLPAFQGPRAVDPLAVLAPVAMVATQPMIVVAHPSFPGGSYADVVDAARRAPGRVPYATSGVGSLAHLTAVWAHSRAGIELLHVPYSGSQSFKDVLTGEVPLAFTFFGSALPLVRNGQLKAIAVTSRRRNAAAPEIPTLHESGIADFESINWQGVLAPAGTPAAVVARLHGELARIAADPEFEGRLRAMGFAPALGPPARFAEEIRLETARWSRIVKAANLKLE